MITPDATTRRAAARIERTRRHRRNQRVVLLVVLVAVVGGLAGYGVLGGFFDNGDSSTQTPQLAEVTGPAQASGDAAAAPVDSAAPTAAAAPTATKVPDKGPGTFTYAPGGGKVLGTKGTLRKFKVAVEKSVGVGAKDFATQVEAILGDPRSWIAGKDVRLQRVASDAKDANFTLYLATATTSEKMCREDGLHTEKYTSCRLASGKVVINLSRWLTAVPDYGAELSVYQAYAINHEVGHQLGHGHEACPAKGKVAPVMQQQTLGLKGCVANAWPYVDGKRYAGDPIP